MAAAIVTTATTLEGQMIEIARELQKLEFAADLNRVVLNVQTEQEYIGITANIPILLTGSGGSVTYTAIEYV